MPIDLQSEDLGIGGIYTLSSLIIIMDVNLIISRKSGAIADFKRWAFPYA